MKITLQHIYLAVFFRFVQPGFSLTCYQCSSLSDPPGGPDRCGAKGHFDDKENVPVDCNSSESYEPGTSCAKITYYGVGNEKRVHRRCASPIKTGTKDDCHDGQNPNGERFVECYCSQDNCNDSGKLQPSFALITVAATFLALKLM